MDIEFHYYITYLTALRAGFSDDDAYIVAYACQQVDDNDTVFKISADRDGGYSNYISQTSNILKAEKELMQIYPIFHFMPGTKHEIECDEACRRDGKFHVLNTIPDNSNAVLVLKEAFREQNLYRIGIAAHMFADTFAHQNFVGYYESFNAMRGVLDRAIPDVGHADAKHDPDLPGLVWNDMRLVRKYSEVSNKDRFLKAAGRLFEEFRRFKRPESTDREIAEEKNSLLADLDRVIGETGNHAVNDENRQNRIAGYRQAVSGTNSFREYEEDAWLEQATVCTGVFALIKPWARREWKGDHRSSHWYRFQEAIKNHQWFTKEQVLNPIAERLELDRFYN